MQQIWLVLVFCWKLLTREQTLFTLNLQTHIFIQYIIARLLRFHEKFIKTQLVLAVGKGENNVLALQDQKQQKFKWYLIIWRHDRPAWVSAWRPYAWFLVRRHLVEAGVLAVLEPCARAPSSRASTPGRPVGLGAVLLLRLRLLRRCLRLLLRCCLLLMLILLLLILGEEATRHGHLFWTGLRVFRSCQPRRQRACGGGGRPACSMGKRSQAACWEKRVLGTLSHTLWGYPICGRFGFLTEQARLKLEGQSSASYS